MFEIEAVDLVARDQFFREHPELIVHSVPGGWSRAGRVAPLAWSEHCVECAVPHCYTSCDLYRARSDGKCRRFTFGMAPNSTIRTWLPYSVEVDFRIISHMWSKGNAQTIPLGLYNALDTTNRGLGILATLIGQLLEVVSPKRKAVRGFYHFRKKFISSLQSIRRRKAEGFLLQVINPHTDGLRAQLVVAPDPRPSGTPLFQASFELPPGFSEHWVPTSAIETLVSLDAPFETSLLLGTIEPRLIYLLSADFVGDLNGPLAKSRIENPLSAGKQVESPTKIKAVVWDLDNTLWEGVLVESGGNPPQLRAGVLEAVQVLDKRGILQSVASKNDHDEAWGRIQQLGLADYFLHPRINWLPKGRNVQEIIAKLNIGADTVAFIDDQPFERAEVAAVTAEVLCLPHTHVAQLLTDPRFKGSNSEEARNRRLYYQTELQRESQLEGYDGDYREFLRSCNLVVDAHVPQAAEYERVHELIQRTNQLNFSGNRYSRDELERRLAEHDLDAFVLHCTDRFGDYGLVGFTLLRRNSTDVRLIDFAMSCRVQSKHVEHAFLRALGGLYHQRGYRTLEAEFRRTSRNAPAAKVFDDLQCARLADEEGKEVYSLDLEANAADPISYVKVILGEQPLGTQTE